MNYCFTEVENYIRGRDSQGLIQQMAPGALSTEPGKSLGHPHSNAQAEEMAPLVKVPVERGTQFNPHNPCDFSIQSCIQSYVETENLEKSSELQVQWESLSQEKR